MSGAHGRHGLLLHADGDMARIRPAGQGQSANVLCSDMFIAMLKPLVTSSIVTGETPVMKMRFTGASADVDVANKLMATNRTDNHSLFISFHD